VNGNPSPSPNVAIRLLPFGFLLLILVATFTVRHIFDWSLGRSVLAVLATLGAIYVVLHILFIVRWLRDKSDAGRLILDCGQNPNRQMYLIMGAYFGSIAVLLLIAIVVTPFFGKQGWQTYLLLFALYFACSTSFFLIMAFGRLQLRENGLRWHRELVANKWDYSNRKERRPGRPRIRQVIVDLTVKFAKENPTWGYDRISGAFSNVG
jgi:hypothetical protein